MEIKIPGYLYFLVQAWECEQANGARKSGKWYVPFVAVIGTIAMKTLKCDKGAW